MLAVSQRSLYKFHVRTSSESRADTLWCILKRSVKTAPTPNCLLSELILLCMLKAHISFIHAAKHLRLLFCDNQISKWKKNGSVGIIQGHVCLSINTHDDSCWDAPLPALFFSHFHCMILMPLNQRLQNHSGRFPADLTSLFTLWVRPSSSMSPVPII